MTLFNRKTLLQKKNNIASNYTNFNFLRLELSNRLIENLDLIKRDFEKALDINCHLGEVYSLLEKSNKVKHITQADNSDLMLKYNCYQNKIKLSLDNIDLPHQSFDIIISVFGLHNINNLDVCLKNIFNILKPGGLFIFSIPTYGTLDNLAQALMETELQLYNCVSPRIHPFSDVKTIANLCTKSGFIDIVVNQDQIDIMYKKFMSILKDLKGMGEGNILQKQNTNILKRNFFNVLEDKFNKYKDTTNDHYKIEVKFCEILAWKP